MNKIRLELHSITQSVSRSNNYAVILQETEGNRRLPIIIGPFEAQAIAVAIEDMTPSRPLTHDLLKNSMQAFDIEVLEVVISMLSEGIFHSKLICEQDGKVIEIDSRTSDALALAVRFRCPIFTFADIMERAGIVLEEGAEKESEGNASEEVEGDSLSMRNKDELQGMIDDALKVEDYELAARIRDELQRRTM